MTARCDQCNNAMHYQELAIMQAMNDLYTYILHGTTAGWWTTGQLREVGSQHAYMHIYIYI